MGAGDLGVLCLGYEDSPFMEERHPYDENYMRHFRNVPVLNQVC